jgi:hypothetical protein
MVSELLSSTGPGLLSQLRIRTSQLIEPAIPQRIR